MQSADANATLPREESRLRHFPISFFAVVMGLAGLTIAWKRADVVFHPPFAVSSYLEFAAAAAFVAIGLPYLWKLASFPADVMNEWRHPVKLNFLRRCS
jgi:tellurite resistance protein